ncbi:hypothetical protein AOLI_G00244610 [Acnodon oligacanthus]
MGRSSLLSLRHPHVLCNKPRPQGSHSHPCGLKTGIGCRIDPPPSPHRWILPIRIRMVRSREGEVLRQKGLDQREAQLGADGSSAKGSRA